MLFLAVFLDCKLNNQGLKTQNRWQIYVYYNKVKSLYVIKKKNNFLYYFYR